MKRTHKNITAQGDTPQRSIAHRVMERCLGLPWLTLTLVALAILAAWQPILAAAMELDRAALQHGELWRLFTGHVAHWSGEHLFWDVIVFTVVGIVCERRSRSRYVCCLLVAAFTIGAGVLTVCPELLKYRGLSGVDCALFACLLADLTTERWRKGQPVGVLLLLGVTLIAKIIWELGTGGALFVQSDVMVPVPESHAIGAVAGVAVAILRSFRVTPEGNRHVGKLVRVYDDGIGTASRDVC